MSRIPVRIATRRSPLARAQANEVRDRLAAAHGLSTEDFEIVAMATTGDRIRDRPLAEVGGKGLFTKEIEEALIDGRADIAVHSAKDLPTVLPEGLRLAAVPPRADARDVFISPVAGSFDELPRGAVLGTASLRRQALARRLRPDLEVVTLRGNVETRLAKLEQGAVQATLLALAGLKRLGMEAHATSILEVDAFLPAIGQGAIAVETRTEDAGTIALLAAIDDPPSAAALRCERAFLAVLEGSCRTPIAGHARIVEGELAFHGMVLSPDGATAFEASRTGPIEAAEALGASAAEEIAAAAGEAFLASLRSGA